MKVAIASTGKGEYSMVSEVSGRAMYYLVYENKKLMKTIRNPFSKGGGGAGFGVVQMLANEGVEAIASGKCGANMVAAMKDKGLKYIEVHGLTVKQAVGAIG